MCTSFRVLSSMLARCCFKFDENINFAAIFSASIIRVVIVIVPCQVSNFEIVFDQQPMLEIDIFEGVFAGDQIGAPFIPAKESTDVATWPSFIV